jgi:hypothetical protein
MKFEVCMTVKVLIVVSQVVTPFFLFLFSLYEVLSIGVNSVQWQGV